MIGTLVPGAILVGLGVIYLAQGNHSAAPMDTHHILPAWTGLASIVLVVNSFFTYAGVEVNAVHVDELHNPGRDYPKSIFVSMALVLAVFIFPTLAIAWVLPASHISFTAGVMQAFNSFMTHFGIGFAVPLIAIALAVGALAGMMAWLDGPSEGLLRIGREQGYLPPYFQKVNGHGVEIRILSAQAVVITIIALLYAFIPTVSSAYWIFTALATQVYLIMYVLMFVSAVRLRRAQPDHARGYRAPALSLLCTVGGLSSVTAFRNRIRVPVTAWPRQPTRVCRADRSRDSRPRGSPTTAAAPLPQARVEGHHGERCPAVADHAQRSASSLPAWRPTCSCLAGTMLRPVNVTHGLDERLELRRSRAPGSPRERHDSGLGVAHGDVSDVAARVVARDRGGHQADTAAGRHQRQDLLHARALGRDASGKAVAALFGQPPRRPRAVVATTGLVMKLSSASSAKVSEPRAASAMGGG